jgi:uncharacterized membrane protein YphA (DoxX/SURF4 family)
MAARFVVNWSHHITATWWADGIDRLSIIIWFYFIIIVLYTGNLHSSFFWNDPVKVQRIQAIMFMKNLAIIGGLLMIIANGSGRYSIKRLLATLRV